MVTSFFFIQRKEKIDANFFLYRIMCVLVFIIFSSYLYLVYLIDDLNLSISACVCVYVIQLYIFDLLC